jgi:hypothetical protein
MKLHSDIDIDKDISRKFWRSKDDAIFPRSYHSVFVGSES